LRVIERIARREKVCDEMVAAVGHVDVIAHLACYLQRVAQEIATCPDMSRPRQDKTSEAHIGPGLEPLQSVPFNQVIAEPAEAVCRLIVAKARTGDHAKPNASDTRSVAVAALDAEIDGSAGNQRKQVRICLYGRGAELGQNVHCREGCKVAHQRQLDQGLDRAAPKLRPYLFVFAARFLLRRVR
jgi:hypothetical protein